MRRTSLSPASPVVKLQHQPSSNRIQFMQYNQVPVMQMQPQPQHQHQPQYHRTLTEEREQSPFAVHMRQRSNISEIKENVQPNQEYIRALMKTMFDQHSQELRNTILQDVSKQWENQWIWIDDQLKSLNEFRKKMNENDQIQMLIRKDQNVNKKLGELEERINGYTYFEENIKRVEEQLKENSRLQQFLAQHEIECTKQKLKQEQQITIMKDELNSIIRTIQNTVMKKSRSTFENTNANITNEDFNYSYKKTNEESLQQQGYDSYIKKYENFNKQVNEYLLNRKMPDNIGGTMFMQNQSIELQDSSDDNPNDFRKNKVSAPTRTSVTFSPKSELSKSSITSEGQESPIKGLMGMGDESQPMQQSDDDMMKFKYQYQCQMSAITEKEEEDESHNYHQKKEQAFNI